MFNFNRRGITIDFFSDDIITRQVFTGGRDGKVRMHEAQYKEIMDNAKKRMQTKTDPVIQMDEHTDLVNQLIYLRQAKSRKYLFLFNQIGLL